MADENLQPVNPIVANQLTATGYVKRTPEQWQSILVQAMQSQNPDFILQPADLQSDMINTSIQQFMQLEDLTANMLNGYGPGFTNNFIFRKFAESIGLCKNAPSQSSVTLNFTGTPFTFIPANTICASEDNSIQVFTSKDITLDSTGKGSVLAETTELVLIEKASVTQVVTLLDENLSVTNDSVGLKGLPLESDEDLKLRVQARFRAPRKGGLDYCYSTLQQDIGCDPRLIRLEVIDNYVIQTESGNIAGRAIHAIVGGGKDNDVANALFLGLLETQKVISQPSQNEVNRSVRVDLKVYNSTIPISFTRPKNLDVNLNVYITFNDYETSPSNIYGIIAETLINYFNTLPVGNQVNKLTLINLALPLLNEAGIPTYSITYFDWTFTLNDVKGEWSSQGFMNGIYPDCYLTCSNLEVNLSTIPPEES